MKTGYFCLLLYWGDGHWDFQLLPMKTCFVEIIVVFCAILMRYLVDYNVIIPMEPSTVTDFEVNTELPMEFYQLIQRSGHQLCFHPAIHSDIDRDADVDRAALRRKVITRYVLLESPPGDEFLDSVAVGSPPRDSNNWVDNQLLAALVANAVDVLVTEDIKMHRKAARLGLSNRTQYLTDAITSLRALFDENPPPPPAVEDVFVY